MWYTYSRGQVPGSSEEKRPMDCIEKFIIWETPLKVEGNNGQESTNPKQVKEAGVLFADAVEACWTNGAPYYGAGKVDAALWAGVTVRLVVFTNSFDVAQHPDENTVCGILVSVLLCGMSDEVFYFE